MLKVQVKKETSRSFKKNVLTVTERFLKNFLCLREILFINNFNDYILYCASNERKWPFISI
jgi:hypothetical protein